MGLSLEVGLLRDVPKIVIESQRERAARVVFSELSRLDLQERARKRLAQEIARALHAAGFFIGDVEQHYSAVRLAELLARTPEYVAQELCPRSEHGPVYRDNRGWLIPASTALAWLEAHEVAASHKKEGANMGEVVGKESSKRADSIDLVRAWPGWSAPVPA